MKKHYTVIGGSVAMAAIITILILASPIRNYKKQTFSNLPDIAKPLLTNHPTGSVLTSIQNDIAKREYHITYDSARHALQSPNRQHNLRAYYQPGSLSIQNRIDSAGRSFRVKLVNKGIYADGELIAEAKANGRTETRDDTLKIDHGAFTEEFINNQAGIRQNFIIAHAPAHTQQLSVHLLVQGLHARQVDDGRLAFYSNDGGERTDLLTYSDLKCWDANGKLLAANLALSGKEIAINVEVANAAYPVTIDPIIANGNPANADKTLEINQSYAWLGFSVSTAGDVNGDGYSDILVGAPKYDNGQADEGAAFLYPGTAGGISLAATVLECNQANAQMGYSVSNAGDINKDGFSDIMVGVPYYDASASNEGVVMIYKGSANGLVTNSPYVFKLDQAEANLGISVAMAGDVNGDGYSDMLAGAHQFDNGQSNEGVGVLILGAPNGLGLVTFMECNQANAMMGFAVAGAGDVDGDGFSDVMAGARFYSNGQALEGAAFIFKGSAAGLITANPTVIESNQVDARLGHALASAGDVNGDGFSDVALGAYQYDKGSSNEGVVMIHYGSANGINTVPALTLESDQAEAQFGISVACAGDVNADGFADLIVGARYYDKGQQNEGAAFIYQGSQNGLNATPLSVLESNQGDAWLGSAVAPAGDVNGDGFSDVLVGSYAFDHGQTDEGSVFVWYGGSKDIENIPVILELNQTDSFFGRSISDAGDVNADGFSDIVVGSPGFDNGQSNEGAAFVYYGSKSGLQLASVKQLEINQADAFMGCSVSSAGDANADGYGDIIVGIQRYGSNQSYQGAAMIYYGSKNGVSIDKPTLLESNYFGMQLSTSVSKAGDVNGDGYGEVLLGQCRHDLLQQGRAIVYFGGAEGISPSSNTTLQINNTSALFGDAVSNAGDVNNDGFDDILVGAPNYNSNGAAFLYYGAASGLSAQQPVTISGSGNTGSSVSSAGDINGDGFGEVLIGAPFYIHPSGQTGAALIFFGSGNGLNVNNPTILKGENANSNFGFSVSSAGDINGDGYSDVSVGSPGEFNGNAMAGAVYLYFGTANGIDANSAKAFSNNQFGSQLGISVSACDVNGDGYSDIVTGAYMYDNPEPNEGIALLYYGNSALGVLNNLRLYNTDLATPINHTQFPQANFGAGLFAKSFTGRNKGKLVWETKPLAQGFSKGSNNRITNSTQSSNSQSAYSNLGTTGLELKNVIDKQGPGTKVRVRVKYDPVLALTGQSYGPWRYLPAYLMGNSTAPVPEEEGNDLAENIEKKIIHLEKGKAPELATIYPNPVSNRLNIDFKANDRVRNLKILAASGLVVYQSNTFQPFIDVSQFPEGAYVLIITKTDGSHTTRKILISR
ncbi:FG-GAP-like repeat-containing protein [Dyadobacter sp. 676]|uniref:FG-GAP-like repeat-containing protein n=1 Tax=Dyadobacter sp. 676 TaxID=3088362 RepID=A0AAU8FE47_9BACT